jgi:hypothetical protein
MKMTIRSKINLIFFDCHRLGQSMGSLSLDASIVVGQQLYPVICVLWNQRVSAYMLSIVYVKYNIRNFIIGAT